MNVLAVHLLLILASAPVSTYWDPAGNGDGPTSASPPPPAFAIKYTAPVRMAYLEHVGPYWMVGPIFRSVGQYMVDHDQAGPMFARYLDNPAEVAARSLRCEIGFVIQGDLQPELPFTAGWREQELVAFLVVEGPHVKTRRYHSMMYSWIEAQGHKSVGPITEVYPDPFAKRIDPKTQAMEIQIPLDDPRAKLTLDDPRVKPAPPEPRALASANVRQGPAGEGSRSVPADPKHASVLGASETGVRVDPRIAAAVDPGVKKDSPVPAAKGTEANRGLRNGVEGNRPAPSAGAQRMVPIRKLIAESRFDRIADRLMPQDDPIPRGLEIWFGQMVLRIGASAKGIKRIYPGEEESVSALAEALTKRYRVVSRDFSVDPLDQVVVRIDSASDPLAARKKAMMRELDGLLAGIALRTVDAEKNLEKLAEVLENVHDLLRTARERG